LILRWLPLATLPDVEDVPPVGHSHGADANRPTLLVTGKNALICVRYYLPVPRLHRCPPRTRFCWFALEPVCRTPHHWFGRFHHCGGGPCAPPTLRRCLATTGGHDRRAHYNHRALTVLLVAFFRHAVYPHARLRTVTGIRIPHPPPRLPVLADLRSYAPFLRIHRCGFAERTGASRLLRLKAEGRFPVACC